jgi:hypothetical protein
MLRKPVRIANFSGYLGDRLTGFDEAMGGDPVDILIGDYLAEITLARFSANYQADKTKGYAEYFLAQIRPHLAEIASRGIKVVVNAGGFNPAGLAHALRLLCIEAGAKLKIAHVEGDNILSSLAQLRESGFAMEHLDTGEPLSSWAGQPIAANAYLGGWGIAAALGEGADVVVCGRVTDASLVVGPCAWWHSWKKDDWNALAGAVLAGHVIECGPQAVGGNFSGFSTIPGVLKPGFPIAEVGADGSSVITKHARDGGAVTVDTVTAQLVYEIQGPQYLNPDVTLNLSQVSLRQLHADRVEVSGAIGTPPPPTTKVAVFAPIGYQIVMTLYVTGLDIEGKVALIGRQVRELVVGPGVDELQITQIGTAAINPRTQWEGTVALRIMATSREREPLIERNFAAKITSLYLCSIPGFYHDTGAIRVTDPWPRIEYWPAVLPVSVLKHRVVLEGGRQIEIEPAAITESGEQPSHAEPQRRDWLGKTRLLPLGAIAYARSGDKGGNSNLGIWVQNDRAWQWLREALSTDKLRHLLPEAAELEILRHEFPCLRAVHFILKGLLGNGGSSNLRPDQVGKAVGEYVLAKSLEIPVELLNPA